MGPGGTICFKKSTFQSLMTLALLIFKDWSHKIPPPLRNPLIILMHWSTHYLTINQPVDYMARGFMILMRGVDIKGTGA